MLYPGGSREQYRYDAVGNPVGYTTRAGQIRTSVFDNRNRGGEGSVPRFIAFCFKNHLIP